jgi:subtilase family serine protease
MRLPKLGLRHGVLLLISILTCSSWRAAAQTTNIPARINQTVDERNLVVLKGNVHPLARLEYDQGMVADAQPIGRMLLLLRRSLDQEASLTQLVDDQQNKSSRNYHAWLTPEQFGKQFGPADADIQAVTQWLRSQGFTGINVGPGRQVIEFSGTAGQVRNAFRTEIRRFMVDGKEYTANAADPQIPAALVPVVAGVVSLHNFPRKSHTRFLGQSQQNAGWGGLHPLFSFPDPATGRTFFGLGPGDFATIYNSKPLIAAGNDGTGQTIAIVGETNINVQDVQQFRKMFVLPANFNATNVVLNGEDPGITSFGEEGESDLDVEWSGAVAPGATIKFVVSASTPASAGIDLSALYIVEHNLAGVVSESYGACEKALGTAGNAFYNGLWEQAAAQGITVVLSSGDGGSAGCDDFNTQQVATQGLMVSGLASTPFNVSVGGTDFDQVNNWAAYWNPTNDPTGTSAKSYIPEIPWNENCAQISLTGCGSTAPTGSLNIVAGSGGPSSLYPKPNWQLGVTGMPNDNHRDQPDISLFASPGFDGSGYIYCQSDQTLSGCTLNVSPGIRTFGIIGGTSASAPAFAGIMALVNQKHSTVSNPAPRQGNANYVLYALAKKSGASCASSSAEAASCIFNDVTKGNSVLPTGLPGVGTNSVPCKGGSPNCSITTAGNNGVLVDPSLAGTEAWTAAAGYDMATGLGSVNVNNLATNWATASTIPTSTTLALAPTSGITHGTSENVTVGITVKPNTGTGVPAGDVSLIATFPDGSTQGFDHFTLASGAVTSAKTQSLPGGTFTVSAHYAGDGTNAPSDSPPVSVTVGKESSQTFILIPTFDSSGNTLNGNATSLQYGSRYIIRMYVTDKNGVASATGPPSPTCFTENLLTCPTGTISLTANGSPIDGGAFALNNEGYTRDIAPTLTGGTYPLVAQYGGDNSYLSSTSATDRLTITPANTTMSVPYIPYSPVMVGTPVSVSSFLISNLYSGVAPAGTITFFDGTTPISGAVTYTSRPGQPGALDASITGSMMVNFTASGTHHITAQYSGDASYSASTSFAWDATALYPTTMTVTADSTTINYGSSVTITAKAMSSYKSPAITGQIGFFANGAPVSGSSTTLTTDASGNQVLTATLKLTPQTQFVSVQAGYGGDGNFQAASNTIGINVVIPDFTLPQNTTITVTAGQTQTATISVTPTSTTPSTVTLASTMLPSGITLSFNPSTVNLNGVAVPVTVTVSTTGPNGGPAAAVIMQVRRSAIGLLSKDVLWSLSGISGLIMLYLLGIPQRRRRFRAVFCVGATLVLALALGCGGGGGGGVGGGSGPVPISITLTTSNAKIAAGGPFTLTATVTSTNTLTGTVNIFQGPPGQGSGVAPPITVVNGKASALVTTYYSPGTYPFWANYSGDTNNLPSQTSTSVEQVFTGTVPANYVGQTGGLGHQGTITINLQ